MALSNFERVGKAMELLKAGLAPFAEREVKTWFKDRAPERAREMLGEDRLLAGKPMGSWDVAALLRVMWEAWNEVFRNTLGPAERSLVSELRDVRNKWAHQEAFSTDDAYRALDSAGRLLTAVSAPEAAELDKMKMEILHVRFDEQVRTEKRKSAGTAIISKPSGNLKPWREVVTPHKDVASGQYQKAEFAADLWQVHMGEGVDEYRDPAEFFRRTYLTDSLRRLLVGALHRLSGKAGEPVVQLQTNFGGGKTHSMLALYHLFSGKGLGDLPGLDAVLKEAKVSKIPAVKRVVLVGNKISPGNPATKPDGTVVRTLWGELAWQLGGKKAFKRIAADDEKATSPGDALRELFNEYGPCLILIDEWVAYARQLHEQRDLPAGTFDTQFTFAQALSEAAKAAKQCLLVISLPASDTPTSPHAQANDAEVGGERGREALERLRNVIGRLEASWRPASAEEGFEIVRRRLFEPLTDDAQFVARNHVAQTFRDFYRGQEQEFPSDCREADYERRMQAAYPIHPEIFDRLYGDWSTLLKFQRTRGVLRLMAAVIHSLWEKGDQNPLILPSNIPIDDPHVQFELTRYLSDNWVPVIEKDVDGPGSTPLRLDREVPNLGKLAACRRVARTIYLGSAPTATAANRGIEDQRVKLGCVMPGESPSIFADALRRMAAASTYLYQDGSRYWYSTQPTVTKLAQDRTEQFKRDIDKIGKEVDKRLRADLHKTGDFKRVHPLPQSGQDVSDDPDARLVVLGLEHPCSRDRGCEAETQAKAILESRGNAPRICRNALVFLAVDKTRRQDLEESVCRYLAWESILEDKEKLNLNDHQRKQAEAQKASADSTVSAQIPEAYQWLLMPSQSDAKAPVEWKFARLQGQENLAPRACRKLKPDDLVMALGATVLRKHMDDVPLWRGDHVSIRQLIEDFARYVYLPRLRDTDVLLDAIRDGLALLSWDQDSFAYADGYDDAAKRYKGLRFAQRIPVSGDSAGLLVKPEAAKRQLEAETPKPPEPGGEEPPKGGGEPPPEPPKPKRFHGTVDLSPERVGRDAGKIAEEVISHLSGIVGSSLTITLEIEADVPNGVPEKVVRVVMENCRTLKFKTQGFEKE
jgi:predicted AAA+ superfamily ATPase